MNAEPTFIQSRPADGHDDIACCPLCGEIETVYQDIWMARDIVGCRACHIQIEKRKDVKDTGFPALDRWNARAEFPAPIAMIKALKRARAMTEIIEALPPSQFRNSAIDMGRQIDAALAKTTED